jgi:hypothetical protein
MVNIINTSLRWNRLRQRIREQVLVLRKQVAKISLNFRFNVEKMWGGTRRQAGMFLFLAQNKN